jgi:arylsulfatase A-like enzyme
VALAVLTGVVACQPETAERLNIVLIVIDTLRYDRLGSYGSGRETSPELDRFAQSAVRVERAYAPAPWTIPSIASMMTGLYPGNHGATKLESEPHADLSMLAEVLKREGYVTGAVVSHVLLQRSGFRQGFDQYQYTALGDPHLTVSSDAVTSQAQALAGRLAFAPEPFFLFVHYFDPHYSYRRHPEYGFAAPSAGRLREGQDIEELHEMAADLSDEELEFLRDLYDEEIRHTDAAIGRLLKSLEERGIDEETLVLIVGDHGEEFVEHGGLGHSRTLYDEVLRVPLLIRDPRDTSTRRVIEGPVSLVALMPTILDLVGVDAGGLHFQAQSFAPLLSSHTSDSTGFDRPDSDIIFSEVDVEPWQAHKKAIVVAGFKLIRDDASKRIELYDLKTDPKERLDLSESAPDTVARLLPLLERQIEFVREGAGDELLRRISHQELEQLRSLGYVGDQ